MKKILINGAGRGCLNLLKAAKKMGLYTIVTGMDGPCIPLADKTYREVHPGHPDEVLEVAKKENVDGIATSCNDMGLESVGYCCDTLNLCGLSWDSAKISSNKLLMKDILMKNGVRTAKFFTVRSFQELSFYSKQLSYPVILKATDLQGSRGICIIKSEGDLENAYRDVMSQTRKDFCIVEEFIEGVEFGAQAFVYKGEILFILPHGDLTFMCKTPVPVGHYMPYQMADSLRQDVEEQAAGAIRAVGLDNCAVNIDFIEKDGKAYVIELTGRGGANGLTDITGLYYGINYYDMILKVALGENPNDVFLQKQNLPNAAKSQMIKSEKTGIVKSLFIPKHKDVDINMFVDINDEVRLFNNCNDAIGEVFVKGKSLGDCNAMVEEIEKLIQIELKD